MGLLDDQIDRITGGIKDALIVTGNILLNRVEDEVIARKRVKLTVTATVELVDKDDKEK